MRLTLSLFAAAMLTLSAGAVEALPMGIAPPAGPDVPIVKVAEGCGPGLVRGRRGACLRRAAVFSPSGHRVIRPGCGKRIGAVGLRTPC